jgi:hypothetical protein
MSTNKKAIGLLLFSGIVIIVSSRRLGIFDIGGWMFNRDKEKSKRTGSTGDFIIAGKTQKFLGGEWRSIKSTSVGEEAGEICEVELVNNTGDTVIFCWVDFEGKLCHYYPVNDGSIRDGSVSNRHDESTVTHHAFVCIKQSADPYPKTVGDIPEEVGAVRLWAMSRNL